MGMTQTERNREAARVRELERELLGAHHRTPAAAEPPKAAAAEPVDLAPLVAEHTTVALEGVGRFDLYGRQVAGELAEEAAKHQAAAERKRREQVQAEEQARLDEKWAQLMANDPQTVLAAIET